MERIEHLSKLSNEELSLLYKNTSNEIHDFLKDKLSDNDLALIGIRFLGLHALFDELTYRTDEKYSSANKND